MNKGKIYINFKKENNKKSILIKADSGGLKYLSDVCLNMIGKNDPSGHFHLSEKMNNLEKGSIDTIIIYDEIS
jgi:hypothetical protein